MKASPPAQDNSASAHIVKKTDIASIPSLDGIRAFSFLLVFASHLRPNGFVPGGLGVTIFFFLSGFLITSLLRSEQEKTSSINIKNFFIRRSFRILPPMYSVLVFSMAVGYIFNLNSELTALGVIASYTHWTNYYFLFFGPHVPFGTGLLWSLSVEEHFYLIFPFLFSFLYKFVKSNWKRASTLGVFCILVLVRRLLCIFLFNYGVQYTYKATDCRLDSILFGCVLALYGNPCFDRSRLTRFQWLYIIFPLCSGLLLFTLVYRDPIFRESFRYSLQGIALMPLFISVIRYPNFLPFRIFNFRAIKFLGKISYAAYLVHKIVIDILTEHFQISGLTLVLISSILTFGFSLIIFHVIERPARVYRVKVLKTQSPVDQTQLEITPKTGY